MRSTFISLLLLLCATNAAAQQNADSTTVKLAEYVKAVYNFSRYIPQEVAYVHMDNTCYYQGDDIFFKCYVTGSNLRPLTYPSRTLYVELLNPGGEVIERQTLKIENGACHGAFSLKRIPFYSGFYEVRAYTKYMLNFGGEAIFSRRVAVFDKPQTEGNFAERAMRKYGTGDYPTEREKPERGKRVNLKFYAEGGNLVQGVASRVAFEMTDAWGNPIEATAQIIDADKRTVAVFAPTHQGRGVFEYTPPTTPNAAKKERVLVEYEGKKFWFDPLAASPAGFILRVDNLSLPDSIEITVSKSNDTLPSLVGVAIISRGTPRQFSLVHIGDSRAVNFRMSKSKLPAGVSQVVMFAPDGHILADRLIFTPVADDEQLLISTHTNKSSYAPFEAIDLSLAAKDHRGNPIEGTMSVAVRDAQSHLNGERNIMTDMLLVSEIKGYVSNPAYYFEADDSTHRAAADLLMMVQGWRRYSTSKMAGVEPFELKYAPEEGIEVLGEVVSFVRGKPKAGVDVSAVMLEKGNEDGQGKPLFFDTFTTDSLGRFAFVTDIEGTRSLILSVAEKGKRKDHRIVLDRVFAPAPRRYEYAELQLPALELPDTDTDTTLISTSTEAQNTEKSDYEAFVAAYRDSLARAGVDRVYQIKAVKIETKKRARERDIFTARSKSVAYYDVTSEIDEASDRGRVIADDIHELLINMNSNFRRRSTSSGEYILYKWKMPLIVVNYERTLLTPLDRDKYKFIRVAAIKSIYVNETLSVMSLYSDPRLSPMDVDDLYSCAVFIETYPDGQIPAETGKGVRRTRLEGYSPVREFYSPDYSTLPHDTDYRRTLYWNPSLTTDAHGAATVRLFHNSRGGAVVVDAQTITSQGAIGLNTTAPTPTE